MSPWQHYEHLLNESSTEISELEGSIELKYGAITKLQEEMMILHMRKDRITADIEQVGDRHCVSNMTRISQNGQTFQFGTIILFTLAGRSKLFFWDE